MRIDAHHHLWKYDPVQYGWIPDEMATIRRSFLPEDLRGELTAAGIDGTVSVQARQTLEETDWLLAEARKHEWILGVVGWLPLTAGVTEEWHRLADDKKLKGVRHVLHDETDDDFMLRDDFNAGIRALAGYGWVYDILILERHLRQSIKLVDRHPGQLFVLDHLGKPAVRKALIEPWETWIRDLAKRENTVCKLSGLVTEARWKEWKPSDLRPYVEVAIEAFGPDRLMFGSDWPVCLVAATYREWVETLETFLAGLSQDDRNAIFGETACRVYNLKTT